MTEVSDAESTRNTRSAPDVDVSVVIPVYNCEKYIEEAISSVREQDIGQGNYEIIAVDDGSTDNSLAILNDLASTGHDLRVFSIRNSGSAAAPRNIGLDKANGRYVFFLDADDKIEPDTLQSLVDTADRTGSGVVLCKLGTFGDGKRAGSVPTTAFAKTRFAVNFIESKAVSTLGALKLFRRSILNEHHVRFPLGFVIGEDQPFTMKAYLYSPHVSILADKVYYWARGRGDGTNVTSTGQPPLKHLDRIMSLIATIVENTEPGQIRDTLLKRPIAGTVGVPYVFGKNFIASHDRAERVAMLEKFRPVITPLWTSRLRDIGIPHAQILTDLAVKGDLNEIERISTLLANKETIPLEFDRTSSQFVYVCQTGDKLPNLRVTPRIRLDALRCTPTSLFISGEVEVEGAFAPPDAARFIWTHRELGTTISHELDVTRSYSGKSAAKTLYSAAFDISEFPDTSIWDAAIEADWNSLTLEQHLGKTKSVNIIDTPFYLGSPPKAAVFFTRFGNLALDIGPAEKHLGNSPQSLPTVADRFTVARTEIAFLSGTMNNWGRAQAQSQHRDRVTELDLIKHGESSASVVVPRSVVKRGPYTLYLIDVEGNRAELDLAGCAR